MATPATPPARMAAPCPVVLRIATPYPSSHATRAHGYALPRRLAHSHALPLRPRRPRARRSARCGGPQGSAQPASRRSAAVLQDAAWPAPRRGSRPTRGRRAAVVPQGAARFSAGPENGEHTLVLAPEHPT